MVESVKGDPLHRVVIQAEEGGDQREPLEVALRILIEGDEALIQRPAMGAEAIHVEMIHAAPIHVVVIPRPAMGVEMIHVAPIHAAPTHVEMIHAAPTRVVVIPRPAMGVEMIHAAPTHVVLIPHLVMTHVNNLPAKQHCPQRHPQRQLLKAQLRRRLSLGQI
jgi:hypothetical protein